MKRSMGIVACMALGISFASSAGSSVGDLENRVVASEGWIAYRVPMIAGVDGPCCYLVGDGASTVKGCDLDGDHWRFRTDRSRSESSIENGLAVYLHVQRGRVDRVRTIGASCPVRTDAPTRWIDAVSAEDSVAMLSSLLDRTKDDRSSEALVALAHHAGPAATRSLAARAEASHETEQRQQALFWLGQTRGKEGASVVERYATLDPDPELRAHAIFALSQSKAVDAYANIATIARNDPDDRVRDQAIFALSQLDGPKAIESLIAVIEGDYPRDAKKRALFWLGQSKEPRALAYIEAAFQ